MRTSLIILAFFGAGLLLGSSGLLSGALVETDLSLYALYLLMFLVGISIGGDKRSFDALKAHRLKLLSVPLITIAGSLAGAALVSLFNRDFSLLENLAVGAGFGYYSLSSVIISEMHSESLGVVALLSNIMREVITLLMAPLMVTWFGRYAPVTAGGATSMDTTLPIISATSGKDFAIIALVHGIILTMLVPFIVSGILMLIR